MSDSRLEKFIYAICSMDVSDLPVPLSRIEKLWNCLITGETPDFEPLSRNEKYLMAMLDRYDISNLPAPMSRGEKLLYKIAVGETDLSDVPGYLSRYEELLKYLIENGGIGFEYVLYTINQSMYTLYTTAEKPVKKAVIHGDTLVNTLQESSTLAVTPMGESIDAQQASVTGTANGVIKSAILKGNTLVNIFDNWANNVGTLTPVKTQDGYFLFTGSNGYAKVNLDDIPTFERGVEYTFIYRIKNSTYDGENNNNLRLEVGATTIYANTVKNGIWKIKKSFSTDETNCFVKILSWMGSTGSATVSLQIIEGDYTNSDIPYFEGMQSVKMPVLTTTGKNLFDGKNMSFGYYRADGVIDDYNHENSLSDYIKVEPSSSYAYKCFVEDQTSLYGEFAFFDENKNFIEVLHAHHTSDTCIITPNNCYYLRAWNNQYINNGNSHPNAMLVKTTNLPSALIYEPYRSNTLTLAEPVTLRKVGDVEDELDCSTGEVTVRIGEIVLDGSESWAIHTNSTNTMRFQNDVIPIPTQPDANIPANILCDKFKVVPNKDWRNDEEQIEIGMGLTKKYELNIRISKTKLNGETAEAFKEYLRTNPVTVQYILKTPTTKTVPLTIQDQDGNTVSHLQAFNETTHISTSSTGLTPNVVIPATVSYPSIIKPSTLYTVKLKHSVTSGSLMINVGGTEQAVTSDCFTITTPATLISQEVIFSGKGNVISEVTVVEGDQTAKDFGYFEGIKSVGLSNKMPVLTTTGINLVNLDKSNPDGLGSSSGNGTSAIVYDNDKQGFYTKTNRGMCANVVLKPNTYYTISSDFLLRENNGYSFLWQNPTQSAGDTYNSSDFSPTEWRRRSITRLSDENGKINWVVYGAVYFKNLQIEEGSTATPYEPYKSNILTVNEDVTLRGIGEVQDTLDCLTGELTQCIGEVVLNGSEAWSYEIITKTYFTNLGDLGVEVNPDADIVLCDKFISYSSLPSVGGCALGGNMGSRNGNLLINYDELSGGVENFKSYLQQNPITIQVPIKESIKTVDLTTLDQDGQPTKLKTFNDISYVEINADNLIPSVDIEVATKINETLATLDPEQLDISTIQNELSQTIDEQSENTDATMMATTEIYEQTL